MTDVLVVGAGIAGLVGARVLEQAGLSVTVLDKGRRPGGRMATRRPQGDGGPVFDHGAQFITLREPALRDETDRWRHAGWLVEWFHGSPDLVSGDGTEPGAGHPRFRGAPYQRALPEALAAELDDVRCGVRVAALSHDGTSWVALTDDGAVVRAHALLCTAPAPQMLALLDAGEVTLPDELTATLAAVTYDPCIAMLATPSATPGLPARGVVRIQGHDVLDLITDNSAKGVSDMPALTIHATAAWSRAMWDQPDEVVGAALVEAAAEVTGSDATPLHVQRWRYSVPTSHSNDLAPGGDVPGPVRFAGDGFAGGRVEGAALSGLTAAQRLLEQLT